MKDVLDDLEVKPENIGLPVSIKSQLENQDSLTPQLAEVEEIDNIPISSDKVEELDDNISTGLEKLNEKYQIPEDIKGEVANIDSIISNVGELSKEKNQVTDLLNTKLIQTVSQRQKARSILILQKLTEAVENALLNEIESAKSFDLDWTSTLDKVFSYQERLDNLCKAYNEKTGIDESLEELRKSSLNKSDKDKEVTLSFSEIQDLIKSIQDKNKDK